MIRKWVQLSFLYLFIVGVLGCLLRLIFFAPVEGMNFKNFLHAHSHVAFLGWIFNALFAGFIFAFIPDRAKSYRVLFWLLQVTVLGMLISFPLQGYAAASISFSTLHIFLSYWFAFKFIKDTKGMKIQANPISLSFIRWSLLFMVLSSIGPFALGAIMAKGLSGTPLYQLAIYFYLHFQYDGWFSFAVFGLFFWLLEKNQILFPVRGAKMFLWMMVISCIPAYALSTLWTHPDDWVYAAGFSAATLQLIALIYLLTIVKNINSSIQKISNKWIIMMLKFALSAFIIKIVLQFASAFPVVADLAYRVRNFTIGYLHIVFLGFVSVFLIAWFGNLKLLNLNHYSAKAGITLFLTGFIFSELIVFLQPLMLMMNFGPLPYSYQMLFFVSLLMPIGTAMILFPDKKSLIFNKEEVSRPSSRKEKIEVFSKT